MFKKIFAFILTLFVLNISILPSVAITNGDYDKNMIIDTSFVSDFNINDSKKNQIVQFISINDYKDKNGIEIPKNTLFNGKIKSMKKGRFGFRRAKAQIAIYEMVLPNGTKYELLGRTKRNVLKGSAIGNTIKGITFTPVALVFGVAGSAVIVVEAVSIIGILLIPPTALGVGGIMGKLVKGVNYKKHAGDTIELQVKLVSKDNYQHILNVNNALQKEQQEETPANNFIKDGKVQLNNHTDNEIKEDNMTEFVYAENEIKQTEEKPSLNQEINPAFLLNLK